MHDSSNKIQNFKKSGVPFLNTSLEKAQLEILFQGHSTPGYTLFCLSFYLKGQVGGNENI